MAYTKKTGLSAATQLISHNKQRYDLAQKFYSSLAAQYCTDIPNSFLFAHLVRVNPNFDSNPTPPEKAENPLTANSYGYLRVNQTSITNSGLSISKMGNLEACTYAWCKAFNEDSRYLHQQYPTFFDAPNEDFWRCAYARMALGDLTFDGLWSECGIRLSHKGRVWDHIMELTEVRSKAVGVLDQRSLKKFVLFEFEFVAQLVKLKGRAYSSGYGREPVMSNTLLGLL
jgi:hypothetical protein